MDEKTLAIMFYEFAVTFAEKHDAPRSAIAAAMMRAAFQLFIESEGAARTTDWLKRETKAFENALN